MSASGVTRPRVLFVCIHNSARSQMAEAFLKHDAADRFEVESAGIEPGLLSPLAVETMREVEIDISGNTAKDVFDFLRMGKRFTHIITVCDETGAERCPVFPGVAERLHWPFEDPSKLTGTHEEKLSKIRLIRDSIRKKVRQFVAENS